MAIGTTAALVGAGVAAAASTAGSMYAANKSKDAADAQVDSQQDALDFQKQQYYTNLQLLKPQMTAGMAAINEMAALMGLGGVDPYGGNYPTASNYGQAGSSVSTKPTTTTTTQYLPYTGESVRNYFGDTIGGVNQSTRYLQNIRNDPEGYKSWWSKGVEDYASGNGGGIGQYYTPSGGRTVTTTTTNPDTESAAATPQSRLQMQQDAFSRFYTSPDYNFRLSEGLKAVDRSAAARGGLLSGAALKASNQYGQNLASSEYGNYWNRLATLAGYGSSSTGQAVGLGQNLANNVSSLTTGMGDARASGYINQANAVNSGLSGLTNSLGMLAGSYGGSGSNAMLDTNYMNMSSSW